MLNAGVPMGISWGDMPTAWSRWFQWGDIHALDGISWATLFQQEVPDNHRTILARPPFVNRWGGSSRSF